MSVLGGISAAIGKGNVAGLFAIGQGAAAELGVFIPNGLLSLLSADKPDDIASSLVEIAQEVAFQSKTATMIYCAGVALTNPDAILQMLNNMACNLCGTMAQILENVMDAVQMQINMAIDTVIGSIGNLISSVLDLINSILRLTDTLLNIPQVLKIRARSAAQGRLNADQCLDLVADILSCLLNKYLGQPLMKFQDKIINKVNEFGYSVNQSLTDEFADLDVLSNYIQREAFMVNKATLLTQGLYANFGDVNTAPEENAKNNVKSQAKKLTVDSNGRASAEGTNTSTKPKLSNEDMASALTLNRGASTITTSDSTQKYLESLKDNPLGDGTFNPFGPAKTDPLGDGSFNPFKKQNSGTIVIDGSSGSPFIKPDIDASLGNNNLA